MREYGILNYEGYSKSTELVLIAKFPDHSSQTLIGDDNEILFEFPSKIYVKLCNLFYNDQF